MGKKPVPIRQTPTQSPPGKANTKKRAGGFEPSGWLKWALLVLVITGAFYTPAIKNELVNWDDLENITDNPNLAHISKQSIIHIFDIEKGSVIGGYNPLSIFTFALEKMATGSISPKLIHFNNILLHLLTVFFVFRLLLHLGIGTGGAIIGALLFGIHPMRVESVAWATERKDVLFAMFFFSALMYYVRWIKTTDNRKKTAYYAIMVVLALLSCLSKVQAVTLPLSMLLIDYWFRRPAGFKLIWEKLPFWMLSLTFGLINIYTLQQQGTINEPFSFLVRLCIGTFSFCVYLYKLIIPYPMSPLYPYSPTPSIWIYLSPILFAVIAAGLYWLWKKEKRMWVFGMLFFFFNVMFLLQVLGAGQGFLADRFTYVPYFGFFALAGWLYDQHTAGNTKMRNRLNMVAGVVFLIYGIWTVKQISIWKNSYTLWTHVIKYESKTNSLPFWNRGQYLRSQGKYDQALLDYEQAVAIEPEKPQLLNSRGKTYFDMAMSGKYPVNIQEYTQKAIADFSLALKTPKGLTQKTISDMLINRGAAYASQGKYDLALPDLNEGLKIQPENKNGYLNRSLVYYNLQQFDKAIADYTIILGFDPYQTNIWYERGMLYRITNNPQKAINDLSKALELRPDFGLAYLERARAYSLSGNKSAAQQDYQKATQLGVQLAEYDRALINK